MSPTSSVVGSPAAKARLIDSTPLRTTVGSLPAASGDSETSCDVETDEAPEAKDAHTRSGGPRRCGSSGGLDRPDELGRSREAYESRSLAIASHWPFDRWGHFLPEHTTAVSILDRLLHHATVVITHGESRRMQDARNHRVPTTNT